MTDDKDFDTFAAEMFEKGGFAGELGLKKSDLRIGLDLAKNRREKGEHVEALQLYAALVMCDMQEPDFQLGLADCAYEMGQFELCLQAASALILLSPGNPAGYYLSGAACLGLGHADEAREDLTEARDMARETRNTVIFQQSDRLLSALGAGDG